MKSFLFSILALLLLITLILCNSFYVKDITARTQLALESLPSCETAGEQAEALLSDWQARKKLLSLSVCAADMSEVENRLTEICVATRLNDEKAFEQARSLCLLGLARIQDLERFSFLHIL